ncbi:YfgM family protein [Vibrio sp. JC009]|uniref:YfgM family protein n=1 Tax=Vibrio sp. JC009 TaxID=2912314 RepID=UPI0023AE9618|nr:YfgM family protein [Vibrio sp. JC009]WED21340.1 YfgM family protein [Vibrio sp. JC009]
MVALHDSEEQQVEAIKDWWKENGKAVILGGVIGLGSILGWQYYQDSVIAAKEAASESYTVAIETLAEQGLEAAPVTQSFIEQNKETEYAALAALQLARVQVEAGELDNALAQLSWVKSNTKDEAILPLVSYRTARIMGEKGELDAALGELASIKASSWSGRVAELKGDLLLRKGDTDGAYSAYTEAQQAGDASQSIQMKLDDLAR